VLGTYVLLCFARDAGIRLVQVSTDEVYGDVPDGASAAGGRPAAPVEPRTPRRRPAAISSSSRPCARSASTRDHTRLEHVRPNQYPEKIVPLFVTNALDGQPLRSTETGTGA
jgi:dTDP-glucose 4,6-dehydratase